MKSGEKNFDKKAIKEEEPNFKVLAHEFFLEHAEELRIFILRRKGGETIEKHKIKRKSVTCFPPRSCILPSDITLSTASSLSNVTKPKPRERPVLWSSII
jgi:hypothetical protein